MAVPFTPSANAMLAKQPPTGAAPPQNGVIPFTPGQTSPPTPPAPLPLPQTGSAGQAALPGSDLKSNIASLPPEAGDFIHTILSKLPGQKIGEAIGTLLGFGLSKSNDAISAGANALGLPVQPTHIAPNYDLSAPKPLQVAGDAGNAALAVAAPELGGETALGRIGINAALGGGAGVSTALSDGGGAKDALIGGLKGAGVGAALGTLGEGATAGLKSFGELLGRTGDKIATSIIKPTQADIKDGFSIDTVKKYDLGGPLSTTLDKTNALMKSLGNQLKTKLASSNASLDLNTVYENTAKRVLGAQLENFGSNTSMEKAVEQLRGEIHAVSGDNGMVSIPDAQTLKQASGTFGAWLFGNPDPEATARQKVYNTFYNELKTAIEKNSPSGVQAINKQFSELIPVRNAVLRRIPVAERNSALSLNDMIGLAASAIEPRALALTLANFAAKSGTAGKVLSKAGAKIEGAAQSTKVLQPLIRAAVPPISRSVASSPEQR